MKKKKYEKGEEEEKMKMARERRVKGEQRKDKRLQAGRGLFTTSKCC